VCPQFIIVVAVIKWPRNKEFIGPRGLSSRSKNSIKLPTTKNSTFHNGWITDADIRKKEKNKKSKEENATTTKYKKPFSKIQKN